MIVGLTFLQMEIGCAISFPFLPRSSESSLCFAVGYQGYVGKGRAPSLFFR